MCNGCRNNFSKSDDKIVIQHAEFCQFTSPCTGLPASKFGNAYYHASRRCIELRWGASFNSSDITIPETQEKRTFKYSPVYQPYLPHRRYPEREINGIYTGQSTPAMGPNLRAPINGRRLFPSCTVCARLFLRLHEKVTVKVLVVVAETGSTYWYP